MHTVKAALDRLEGAWKDMETIHVAMTVEQFKDRLASLTRRCGIRHSSEWIEQACLMLSSSETPNGLRNAILSEVNPRELQSATARFDRAAAVLVFRFAEFAHTELRAFLDDSSKNEMLRRFVWFRIYMPALAHRAANRSDPSLVGFDGLMPFVEMRPYQPAVSSSGA